MFTDWIQNTFLLHVPHSSVCVPFTNGFDIGKMDEEIKTLTDHGSDYIFNVPKIDKIVCPWSRVFCDVERYTTDPLEAIGQGFFYTKTSFGEHLRDEDPENKKLILSNFYEPYHNTLKSLIRNKINEYGVCRIVDCHTFPTISTAAEKFYNVTGPKPDICIGVNPNTPVYMKNHFVNHFKKHGLNVQVNFPYSGSLLPEGFSDHELVSIMIEVNRQLLVTFGKEKLLDIITKSFEEF